MKTNERLPTESVIKEEPGDNLLKWEKGRKMARKRGRGRKRSRY